MPQMSPMPWLILSFLTLISLMMVISMIYFNSKKSPLALNNINQKIINMKW